MGELSHIAYAGAGEYKQVDTLARQMRAAAVAFIAQSLTFSIGRIGQVQPDSVYSAEPMEAMQRSVVSVIVLTRNAPRAAHVCLESLLACAEALSAGGREVEFVLADDCSVAERSAVGHFQEFRGRTNWPVTAIRFTRRQHYGRALASAMSRTRGDVLFLSHDMLLTPDCVEELYAVAGAQPTFGVFRPRSGQMDWAEKMAVGPEQTMLAFDSAARIAREVRAKDGGQVIGWPALIGDAMFIRRAVIERIGVLDPRFWGFWADIDYGVRVQRAGWRHGIAAGAWLYHFGAASAIEPNPIGSPELTQSTQASFDESDAAYALFRQKWGESLLPQNKGELTAQHFRDLRRAPAPAGGEFQPPLELDPGIAQVL